MFDRSQLQLHFNFLFIAQYAFTDESCSGGDLLNYGRGSEPVSSRSKQVKNISKK